MQKCAARWADWLCYFAGSSKSHRENSISFIFLELLHQVDMKNVVESSKHFFGYFNTLETHNEIEGTLIFRNLLDLQGQFSMSFFFNFRKIHCFFDCAFRYLSASSEILM